MIKKPFAILICFVVMFTSGCYTMRPVRTLEKMELRNAIFQYGDWVLIGYQTSSENLKWQKGKVKRLLDYEIILEGEHAEIRIPMDRIVRVHVLKKKLNPGGTVVLATGLTLVTILTIALLKFAKDPVLVY
jgi:hypothetical protein